MSETATPMSPERDRFNTPANTLRDPRANIRRSRPRGIHGPGARCFPGGSDQLRCTTGNGIAQRTQPSGIAILPHSCEELNAQPTPAIPTDLRSCLFTTIDD